MEKSDNRRPEKVSQLIKQGLSQLLIEGLKDPRIGYCTVTEVRCAPDLKSARIYISVYGSEEEQKQTLEGLQRAVGFLKREIAKNLQLRFAPQLHFVLDGSLAQANRMEQILTSIRNETPFEESEEDIKPMWVTTNRSLPTEPESDKITFKHTKSQARKKKNKSAHKLIKLKE